MIEHRVALHDSHDNFVADISNFVSLQYGRSVNEVGALSITLSRRFYTRPIADLDRDWIIRVYRKIGNENRLVGQTYWLLDDEVEVSRGQLTLKASDAITLLKRRLVAYHDDITYQIGVDVLYMGRYEGNADEALRWFFRYNYLEAIDITRNTAMNLQMSSQFSQSEYIEARVAWTPVLDALNQVAEKARATGVEVFFDMVCSDALTPAFATFVGQRGRNLVGKGVSFSTKNGLIEKDAKVTFRLGDYADVCYVGGHGQGAGRLIRTVNKTVALASPFHRTEVWLDARDYDEEEYLDNLGLYELDKRSKRVTLQGKVSQLAAQRFGLDYDYGDRVEAHAEGYTFDCHFSRFAMNVTQKGEELDLEVFGEKNIT